ncbi:MAG: histidinol-phosphatase [Phycisphaeraceae bacterium]
MPEALLYETHMHTPLCKHARGEPEEYAQVAFDRNLRGITVTCHNPMPDRWSEGVRMGLEEFDEYLRIVERAKEAWQGRVDVRLGIEADYFPGYEEFVKKQVAATPFSYVIGSVHPQTKEYKAAFWKGDPIAYFKGYYEHLAAAAELGVFDCISHPDIVKNIAPSKWDVNAIMDDVRRCLDRIAKVGCAMELNTSGVNKDLPEMNPGVAILKEIKARDIAMVIGADAHVPQRVGDGFVAALDILEGVGFTQVHYFLDRKRVGVDIPAARASLTIVR